MLESNLRLVDIRAEQGRQRSSCAATEYGKCAACLFGVSVNDDARAYEWLGRWRLKCQLQEFSDYVRRLSGNMDPAHGVRDGMAPEGRSKVRRPMADREGFEPSRRLPAYTLSKRAPSTARPPVRKANGALLYIRGAVSQAAIVQPPAVCGWGRHPLFS